MACAFHGFLPANIAWHIHNGGGVCIPWKYKEKWGVISASKLHILLWNANRLVVSIFWRGVHHISRIHKLFPWSSKLYDVYCCWWWAGCRLDGPAVGLKLCCKAMSEATSPNWLRLSDQPLQIVDLQRPWSVKVHGADLGSWVACGWWPQDTERFNIQRSGLHLPAAEFVPKFPLALQKAFSELSETRSELQKATNKVLSACCPLKGKGRGGRGKGKEGKEGYGGQIQNERPFSEAMSIFKAHLETLSPLPLELSKETPSRLIKDYLANLESIEAPESINYDFMALVGKCFKTWETDVVFGIGKTCSESLWNAGGAALDATCTVSRHLHRLNMFEDVDVCLISPSPMGAKSVPASAKTSSITIYDR